MGDSGDEAALDQVYASGEERDTKADRKLGRALKRSTGANSNFYCDYMNALTLTAILNAFLSDGA